MALPPIVALEIGTSKIIALVGELREGDQVMITGMGEHPSVGVRKGEIIDFENAAVCVRAVLEAAENSGRVAIRQVHLAVSGGHIQNLISRGSVPVLDKDSGIVQEDIDNVMEVARAVNLPSDRDVIHTICQHFSIDDHGQVIKPEGMEGAKLSVNMLVLHGIRSRLRNAVRVVHNVSVEVQDAVFSGLCSALSVLTAEQKKSGVVVIDFGGGTTDYLVYADNVVASAGVLGVGGDHLTNDIALGFNIPISQAERLKRVSGSAVVEALNGAQKRVSVPPEVGFPGRSISLRALHTVINARADEILNMVKRRLQDDGILHRIGAGVVLTGGGAHLNGMVKLTEDVFKLPCSIGRPRNISGLATATEGPEYAACSGLVQYGFRTMAGRRQTSGLGGLFGRLLGR
ncbi:cell division protein FtsA [Verrucomicrobiota bacterium]